jgi:hypothetical protein
MPRYFFNVMNDVYAPDLDGVVLPNLEAAKGEAEKDIEDIKLNRFKPGGDWSKWSIEICDQKGDLLLVVPFSLN